MSDAIYRDIGRLDGRVTAMESRMDRHEAYVGEELRGVRSQLKSMDEKLDRLTLSVEAKSAESIGQGKLIKIAVSVFAAAGGLIAAIAGLFGIHINGGIH